MSVNAKRMRKEDKNSMIIMLMYKEAKKHPADGQWRRYESTIKYHDRHYYIKGDFVLSDEFFTYKDLVVKAMDMERSVILN